MASDGQHHGVEGLAGLHTPGGVDAAHRFDDQRDLGRSTALQASRQVGQQGTWWPSTR
jgi:hypothetical protein